MIPKKPFVNKDYFLNVVLKNMEQIKKYQECELRGAQINHLLSSIKLPLKLRIKLFFSRLISFLKKLLKKD